MWAENNNTYVSGDSEVVFGQQHSSGCPRTEREFQPSLLVNLLHGQDTHLSLDWPQTCLQHLRIKLILLLTQFTFSRCKNTTTIIVKAFHFFLNSVKVTMNQKKVLLTKCGPKRFLLTECGPYNVSVVPVYFVGIIIIT